MYKKNKNIISNNLMIGLILPAFISCNNKNKDQTKGTQGINYGEVEIEKIPNEKFKEAGYTKIDTKYLDEQGNLDEEKYMKEKNLMPVADNHKIFLKSDGTIDVEKVRNEITKDQLEKLIGEKKETLGKQVILDIIKSDPHLRSLVEAQIIEFNGTIFTINNSNKVADPKKVTTGQVRDLSLEVLAGAVNRAFQTYTGNSANIAEVKEEGGNKSVQINAEVLLRDKKIISEGKNPFFDPKDGKPIEKAEEIAEKNPELFKEIILGGQGTQKLNEIFSSVNSKVSSIEILKDPSNEKDLLEAIKKAEIFNKSLYKDSGSSQEIAEKMVFSAKHQAIEILSDPVITLNGVDVITDTFKKCFGDQTKDVGKVTEVRANLAKSVVGVGLPASYLALTNTSFNSMKAGEEKYYYSLEDDKNETFYVFKVKCNKEYIAIAADTKTSAAEVKGEYEVTKTLCKKAEYAEKFSEKFINKTKKEDIWKLRGVELKENAATDIDVAREVVARKDENFFKKLTKELGIPEMDAEGLVKSFNETELITDGMEVLDQTPDKFTAKSFGGVSTAHADLGRGSAQIHKFMNAMMRFLESKTKQELNEQKGYTIENKAVLIVLRKIFSKLSNLAERINGQVELKNASILNTNGSNAVSLEVYKDSDGKYIFSFSLEGKTVLDPFTNLNVASDNQKSDAAIIINTWIANRNDADGDKNNLLNATVGAAAGKISGAPGEVLTNLKVKGEGSIEIVEPTATVSLDKSKKRQIKLGTVVLEKQVDRYIRKVNFVVNPSNLALANAIEKIYPSVQIDRYFQDGLAAEEKAMVEFEAFFSLDKKNRKKEKVGGVLGACVCSVEFCGKDLAQA